MLYNYLSGTGSVQRGPPRYVLSIIYQTVLQLQDKTVLGVHIVTPSIGVLQGWKPKQGMSTPSPATCHFTRHFKLFHPESHGFEATKHLGVFCRFFGLQEVKQIRLQIAPIVDMDHESWYDFKRLHLLPNQPTISLWEPRQRSIWHHYVTMFWKASRPSFINQLAKETWHI